ncbi:MAG: hypothetical protein ACJAYK_002770 [Crocinitomicaceae bacterium]|jgi:hypothetical protein
MPVNNKSYPQGVCPFTPNILIVINKKEIFILIKQLEIVLNCTEMEFYIYARNRGVLKYMI